MFDDKKKQFEKQVELDSEKKFKVASKRNKLLGQWAAKMMGIEDNTLIENYIEEIIEADFIKPGSDDVLEKIDTDFKNKNLEIKFSEIEKKLLEFEKIALEEIGNI